MFGHLNHIRLLRFAGLFTWGMVGCWLLSIWLDPGVLEAVPGEDPVPANVSVRRWLVCYFAFGAVYWWITQSLGQRRTRLVDHLLLLILTACAIAVSFFSGTGLGSILLMVVAGLLPWLLRVPIGIAWLIAGNVAIIPVFTGLIGMPPLIALVQSLVYVGFSSFVFVTSLVARQQWLAREEQRQLNAELRATRALLAESARVNERTRISRELHDLLGHHLTALSLNLEVAGHLAEGRVQEHVGQAHTLAKLLLSDVREAVSQLRAGGAIDMAATLSPLAENVPGMEVRIRMPEPFLMDDAERAHVLLRCTQEIITNAVRHAKAEVLKMDYGFEDGGVRLRARDDGEGCEQYAVGNGLRGIRERMDAYGGRVEVSTAPGEGFCLDLYLPLDAVVPAARNDPGSSDTESLSGRAAARPTTLEEAEAP